MHNRNRKSLLGFFGRWILGALLLAAALFLPAAQASAEDVFYYHNDALGSPVAMTNDLGAVVWKADYQPFGEELITTNTEPNAHRFTGKELDVETGLHYFGARYYDARLGRFISADPAMLYGRPLSTLILPQRHNLYAYTTNNPYRYVDPDGEFLISTGFAIGFGVAIFNNLTNPSAVNAPSGNQGLVDSQTGGEFTGDIIVQDTVAAVGGFVAGKVVNKIPKISNKADDIADVVTRRTRKGKPGVKITKNDGSAIDITEDRVKEFVPNTHPKAPPGAPPLKVKFKDTLPGSKGLKRSPTTTEKRLLKDLTK